MIANEMAIGTNFLPKAVPKNMPERKTPEKVSEKPSKGTSDAGEVVRENEKKVDMEVLERGIEKINQNIKIFNTKLSFSIDKLTGRTVIKISDMESEEVIREVPPMEFLKIAAKLSEVFGLIIDRKA